MSVEACDEALEAAAARLQPLLGPLGFAWRPAHAGVAHGAFASGFFARDDVRIGLIYRGTAALGAVVYENDATNAAHDDVMRLAGASPRQLDYDETSMRSVARDGGDAIAALAADLTALTPLLADPPRLAQVIAAARAEYQQRLTGAIGEQRAKRESWLARRKR